VEVVNMPSDDPDVVINLNQMPERAMYLRCDQLLVYNLQQSGTQNAQNAQEMEARGNASVQSGTFWGRADVIKYDESKELMIFEAREGRLATLVRQKAKGAPQEELKGQKIYYWRNTGDFKIERGTGARVIQ
jgi:lipopolysaccharide export system protein LptA